jgi:predicted DNA-binding ribbon-helix-helix protein
MQSVIIKRSVDILGRKTSVSLEEPFWLALKHIAAKRAATVGHLVASIDAGRRRENANLSSAIRLFVLDHYQNGPGTSLLHATDGQPAQIAL